jgi:VIT1/CCC1 family predicted Fe2+/Mn2+ transporter
LELEREHLEHHRGAERDELREMFGGMGLSDHLVEEIVESLDQDDEAFLKVMMALEFGVVEEERRSPIRAAVFSGLLFLVGSLPSVLPFVFVTDPLTGLWISAIACGIALFIVGAVKTVTTRTNPLVSGFENMGIAAAGAVLSYVIGRIYDTYA